jgi:hypothetical protein
LEADLWTSNFFAASELGGYRLRYDTKVSAIELRPNTFSSRWEDVVALVGKGLLVASCPDAAEDCSAEFRQAFGEAQEENPHLGAAIRWTIQAKDNSALRLVLQCLPSSAERLRADPRLSADDGPGIHLDTVDLDVEMLTGEPGPGPVPVLFARDPGETRDSLSSNPGNIVTGIFLERKNFVNIVRGVWRTEEKEGRIRGGGGGIWKSGETGRTKRVGDQW